MGRDPKRIDDFLDRIKKIWKNVPDLRFGQLIENMTKNPTSLYYMEDNEFIDTLESYYNILFGANQKIEDIKNGKK